MSRRRAFISSVAVALIAVMAPVSPAWAVVTTNIDFEGFAAGTEITTQYSPAVTFADPVGASTPPRIASVAANEVLSSQCPGCEFDSQHIDGTLNPTANSVSFKVRHPSATCSGAFIHLRVRNTGNGVLTTTSVAAGTSFTTITASAASGSIASFELFSTLGTPSNTNGCHFEADDMAITSPDAPTPQDFNLSAATTVVTVAAGVPASLPISINRFNGSNGDVDLDNMVTMLPGVGTSFTPSPVTGTGNLSTFGVTALPSAPFDEVGRVARLRGTPEGPQVGPGPRVLDVTVRVVPTLKATAPAALTVPVCSTATATVFLNRVDGYAGTATLATTGPTGLATTFEPATSTASSVHSATLSAGPLTPLGTTPVTVGATAAGASVATAAISTTVVQGSITTAPEAARAGHTVILTGTGFCPDTSFRFGNDAAAVTPAESAYNSDRTQVTLTVPRQATTGAVRAVSTGGTQTGPVITIGEFRRDSGFRFENYITRGVNHQILADTYGSSETNFKIDLCWPFGCNIVTDLPDPMTLAMIVMFNDILDGGSCFGLDMVATRMARGAEPLAPHPPASATTPWDLTGTSEPSTSLRSKIAGWHTTQLSAEFINRWIAEAGNGLMSEEGFKSKIRSLIGAGPLMISIKQGGAGHALVGYGFRDNPDGSYDVDVYDPNVPFHPDENIADGVVRADRLDRSALHFSGGRWTLRGMFATPWTGGRAEMALVPYSQWPRDPTLPTSPGALFTMLLPRGDVPPGAVTDSSGRTLSTTESSIPGSTYLPSLSGEGDSQVGFLVPSSAGAVTYRADGAGEGLSFAAADFAGSLTGADAAGDRITTDPSKGLVALDGAAKAGAVDVDLVRREAGDGGQRTASLRLSGVGSSPVSIALDRGKAGLTLRATSALTLKGTIGWAGSSGIPASVKLPRIKLAAGQSVTVAPKKWNQLTSKPTLIRVKSAAGKVLSTRVVKAKEPKLIKKSTLSVSTRKVKVVTVAKPLPVNTQLAQVVQIKRGNKVVKTLRHTTSFSGGRAVFTARLKLPPGSYTVRSFATVVVLGDSQPVVDTREATSRLRLP